MSKEGQFISYTGPEAAALRGWDLERDVFFEHIQALQDRLADDADAQGHLRKLEELLNAVTVEWTHVLGARLVRVLPHLADVIALLLWPEFMPAPPWVDEGGYPPAAVYPVSRGTVDYDDYRRDLGRRLRAA